MKKIDNSTKIKLLFILLMSNISIYLFSSSSEVVEHSPLQESIFKEGYSELKVHANLLTSFEENKAVSILDTKNRVVIKYALLLQQVNQSQNELNLECQGAEYIIYLPNTEITKLLQHKALFILPYGKHYEASKTQRKSYEITI